MSNDELDDVVARARDGNPDAWRELHSMHAGRLVAWLRLRPTGDYASSPDDLAAETWLVAASKIADFSGDADAFGAWLFGIARKLGANVRRTAQRRSTTPTDQSHPFEETVDQTLEINERQWIAHVISTLPERERDAVALVDGLGLDQARAAEVLGVSSVSLRVARHRGLKKLRKLLDGN